MVALGPQTGSAEADEIAARADRALLYQWRERLQAALAELDSDTTHAVSGVEAKSFCLLSRVAAAGKWLSRVPPAIFSRHFASTCRTSRSSRPSSPF